MIPCTTATIGNALSYCASDPYGPATLYIGEVVNGTVPDVFVMVENLATGRTSYHVNTGTLPLVQIDHPAGLSPGQMYRIGIDSADSAAPLAFKPYVWGGAAFAIGTVQVEAVHVNMRKVLEANGDVSSPSEQWLNI